MNQNLIFAPQHRPAAQAVIIAMFLALILVLMAACATIPPLTEDEKVLIRAVGVKVAAKVAMMAMLALL